MSSRPARWCCVRSRERQLAWMLHTRSSAWKKGSPIWAPYTCRNTQHIQCHPQTLRTPTWTSPCTSIIGARFPRPACVRTDVGHAPAQQ